MYLTTFLLKSYFKLLEVLKNIIFIFNNIDIRNIGKVILKNNKILILIKIYKGNRVKNIIINKLY